MGNGLRNIRLHRGIGGADAGTAAMTAVEGADAERTAAADPEGAARRYLNMIMSSDAALGAQPESVNEQRPEYKYLGIDKIPFTKSQHVKFSASTIARSRSTDRL